MRTAWDAEDGTLQQIHFADDLSVSEAGVPAYDEEDGPRAQPDMAAGQHRSDVPFDETVFSWLKHWPHDGRSYADDPMDPGHEIPVFARPSVLEVPRDMMADLRDELLERVLELIADLREANLRDQDSL